MPMSPRLLRPRAGGVHPEAAAWRSAVIANGGSVSGTTLAAVDKLCKAIDAAGIRDRFVRLNLFCGTGLSACLVPLYRGFSSGGTQFGNTTDTNNGPFVAGDYNETGASSGLKANGTSKYLDTGVMANELTASNSHLGIGLRSAESRSPAARTGIGAYNNGNNSFEIQIHKPNFLPGAAFFTRFATVSDVAGDTFGGAGTPLGTGDLLGAWPSFFRNGAASGATATTSQNYPSAHRIFVFANNNSNTSVIGHTDARMNWYSIGLTMTAAQAAAFTTAVQAFNSTLSRT